VRILIRSLLTTSHWPLTTASSEYRGKESAYTPEKTGMLVFIRRHDRRRLNHGVEVNLAPRGWIDRNVRWSFHGWTRDFRAILRAED